MIMKTGGLYGVNAGPILLCRKVSNNYAYCRFLTALTRFQLDQYAAQSQTKRRLVNRLDSADLFAWARPDSGEHLWWIRGNYYGNYDGFDFPLNIAREIAP